jgi:hypothetical protein
MPKKPVISIWYLVSLIKIEDGFQMKSYLSQITEAAKEK